MIHRGEIARAFETGELPIDLAEQRGAPTKSIDGQFGCRIESGKTRLAERRDGVVKRLILVKLAREFRVAVREKRIVLTA